MQHYIVNILDSYEVVYFNVCHLLVSLKRSSFYVTSYYIHYKPIIQCTFSTPAISSS